MSFLFFIIAIVFYLIWLFISPVINFAIGYLVGIFAKITIGNSIIAGLTLLGIHISLGSIPLLFGLINLIASFFYPEPNFFKHSSDD